MGIPVTCESCAKKYSVKEDLAGKKIKCPGCGGVLSIPALKPAEEPKKAVSSELSFADDDDGAIVVCINCGLELPPKTKVCVECGFHIASGSKLETLDIDKYIDGLDEKKKITIPRPMVMYIVGGGIALIALAALGYGAYGKLYAEEPSALSPVLLGIGGVLLLVDFLFFTGKRIALTIIRAFCAGLCGFTFWMVIQSFTKPLMLAVYIPAVIAAGVLAIMSFDPKNDDYCIL